MEIYNVPEKEFRGCFKEASELQENTENWTKSGK